MVQIIVFPVPAFVLMFKFAVVLYVPFTLLSAYFAAAGFALLVLAVAVASNNPQQCWIAYYACKFFYCHCSPAFQKNGAGASS